MVDSMSDALLAEARQVFVRSFASDFTLPVIARAEGATITDVDGKEYLDFSSGQMCATVGHNHPRIADAVRRAADRAVHINSAMLSPEVIAVGRRVVELLPPPLDKVFFLSTGGESNEAALKIAKKVTGRYEIVGDVRGRGLLMGLDFVKDRVSKRPAEAEAEAITRECLKRGLFLAATRQPGRYWVWRVAPPLTISRAEIDRALEIIDAAIRTVVGS